jgi:hypothetical protein
VHHRRTNHGSFDYGYFLPKMQVLAGSASTLNHLKVLDSIADDVLLDRRYQ